MLASACGCWNFWELEFLPAFGWSGAAEKHSRSIYCTADCHHSFGRKSDFACLTLRFLVRVGGLSLKTRVDFCMLICLCFWSCTMDMDDVKTSTKIIWPLKSTVGKNFPITILLLAISRYQNLRPLGWTQNPSQTRPKPVPKWKQQHEEQEEESWAHCTPLCPRG